MGSSPTDFWGKLERSDEGCLVAWHPLADHCADVAACTEALLSQSVLRRRLARLGGLSDLASVDVARLSVLAGLHDIGKYNHGFQNKALARPPFTAGHVREALALFGANRQDTERLAAAIGYEALCDWFECETDAGAFLVSSISHHGRPEIPTPGRGYQASYWEEVRGRDPFAGIAELHRLLRKWFPQAWDLGARTLPGAAALQHAFSGLVMLADWIGSDTRFFPLSVTATVGVAESKPRMAFSRQAASDALAHIGIDVRAARMQIGASPPRFDRISTFEPRPAQKQTLGLPASSDGSITVLEAKTGDGKTEAALARFLTLFQAGEVDGMYFALPTRTAATQIHTRVVAAVCRAFPDGDRRPPVVLAVPGYLAVDDQQGCHLPGFNVLWNDNEKERWRFRGWAAEHPKRFLAGAVVVGTVDQLLLSVLAVSHAHLRSTARLRHLLVVDEVHASDAYMTRILEEVLYHHQSAGGHALLMSATLGGAVRARLLSPRTRAPIPSREEARRVVFPLITHREHQGGVTLYEPGAGASRSVAIDLRPLAEQPAEAAGIALAAAQRGARVLVIRNTVTACLETQVEVERLASEAGLRSLLFGCGDQPAPHHSRFAREDRQALDNAIETYFGKERPDGGCVAVATQTVQQSLDLDSDLLLTDLCPIDVLLQRIGRLHRHERENRPVGFDSARAVVLTPEDRDLTSLLRADGEARGPIGLGTVYPDLRIIEATWRLLDEAHRIRIPADCRRLVEDGLHPEALREIEEELGECWEKHGRQMLGAFYAQSRQADLNLANFRVSFGLQESLFPEDELHRFIKTRLGEGDRIVRLEEPEEGPFGTEIRAFSIPSWMAVGTGDGNPYSWNTDDEGVLEFTLGERRFRYDRLGLRLAEDSQEMPRNSSTPKAKAESDQTDVE